jgi:hypothetical protein
VLDIDFRSNYSRTVFYKEDAMGDSLRSGVKIEKLAAESPVTKLAGSETGVSVSLSPAAKGHPMDAKIIMEEAIREAIQALPESALVGVETLRLSIGRA